MALSGAAVGSLLGLGVQLYANAVRKLPLMRNPWEHVIGIGLGGYAGKWLVEFEERTALELDEILQRRAEARLWRHVHCVPTPVLQVYSIMWCWKACGGDFQLLHEPIVL